MNISYSAIDEFLTCPLKYKYSQIDKLAVPKSKEQVFGTLIHSTMKYIHGSGMISPSLEQSLNYFSQKWNSDVFSDPSEERATFSQGIKMIQNYYATTEIENSKVVATECRFDIHLEDLSLIHI